MWLNVHGNGGNFMTNTELVPEKGSRVSQFFKNMWAGIMQIPREHKGFAKQTFMLAKEDLIKTYKGAILGPFWAVMKPLFQLFVYWFAFTIGFRSADRTEMGAPYFIFLMVGFIPWAFMSDAVSRGSKSIADNRQFVTKVSFPVSVIMTYTTISKFYVHIFLFSLGYIYLMIMGYQPSLYNLQVIPLALIMFIFFLALQWSLAPMCAFSKDFSSFINTIMSGLFWLSGVCYDSYTIKDDTIRMVLLCNPMTYFSNAYRKALICGKWVWEAPDYGAGMRYALHPLWENAIFLAELALVVILGIYNYNRLRKELPDVL